MGAEPRARGDARGLSDLSFPIAGSALILAALAGYLVPRSEDLLELELTGSAPEVIALAAIGLGTLGVLRYPKAGLIALTLFVYLNVSETLVRQHQLPSLLQWLALPLGLAALSEYLSSRRRIGNATALPAWLAAYSLVILASSALAANRGLADEHAMESAKCLAIFFLVVGLATTLDRIEGAVAAMVGAGALMGGLGVFQFLTGRFDNEMGGLARIKQAQIYGDVFEPRIAGSLGDPNFFAQVLVLLVPLALYSAWSARSRRGRIAAYLAGGLIAAALILTYSRGAALALALVVLLMLYERGIRRETAAALVVVVVASAWFVPSGFSRRLETIEQLLPSDRAVSDPDSSFEKRKLLNTAAGMMFLDHPGWGVGAGNFTVHFATYADEIGSTAQEYDDPAQRNYAHSLPLQIAAETGLVGIIFFAGIVATCFIYLSHARQIFLDRGKPSGAAMATALTIGLVGYLVAALFLHGHFQRYLWLAFGLMAALYRVARAEEEEGVSS